MTSADSFAQSNAPHVGDQIEAYLFGGLSTDERGEFEAHVAGCPGCLGSLEQARKADSALVDLFGAAQPDVGFEGRLLGRLGKAPASRWTSRLNESPVRRIVLHPAIRRAAVGVAAAVVLAAVGHAARSGLDRQTLPGMRHGTQLADLRKTLGQGQSLAIIDNSNSMRLPTLTSTAGEEVHADVNGPVGFRSKPVNGEVAVNAEWFSRDVAATGAFQDFRKHRGDVVASPDANDVAEGFSDDAKARGGTPDTYYRIPVKMAPAAATPLVTATPPPAGVISGPVAALGTSAKPNSSTYFLDPSTGVPGSIGKTAAGPATPPDAGIAKSGGGTLSLSSTNGYVGGVQVAGGTLAPPASSLTIGGIEYSYGLNGEAVVGRPVAGAASLSGGTIDTNGGTLRSGRPTGESGPVAATELGKVKGETKGTGSVDSDGKDVPGMVVAPGFESGFKPAEVAVRAKEVDGDVADGRAKASGGDAKPGQAGSTPTNHSEPAGPDKTAVTRVYDVRDLVINVPDFTDAPKFVGGGGGGAGGGGGGGRGLFGGGAGGAAPETGKTREQAVEDITKLIQETVAADTWKETGGEVGAVKELSGQLVVTQTPENQRRVAELLGQLRGSKKGEPAKPGDADAPGAKLGDAGAPDAKPQAAEPKGSPESTEPPAPAGGRPGAAPSPVPTAGNDRAQAVTPPPATPVPAPVAPAARPVALTPAELQAQAMQRKIIRNGEMLFDVDSFDSSMMLVGKIAAEEGAFIATTDSEKLPNGKVKGSVIVRCPPDRLNTLVLKLRGLGDLKSQRIAAQDITKQYTDLESQLRAAHAMEDRLLGIIKDGKGAIKDLLEAEKQLGVWREKLEALEGEVRYYNNLVSLSTLTVTLMERDIKTPYATAQSEQVSMGVVAEDVEKARADAIAQIESAKGRILESDLKKHEAAQFSATIVADVAPDAADPLIDRLKQIGRVARLERERKQTSEGGTGAPPPGLKIERKDTRLQLSIYNLADVSPRTSTSMNLAAADVEKSYKSIVDQVKAGGGRIVSSQLNRPKADQVTGTVTFDVPSEKADVLSAALRSGVEVMRLDVTENKDTQDVTDAKRGFVLQIYALASVAPRETTTLQIASKDVPSAFNKLLEAARSSSGRISTSQLNEQNVANITGTLDFDVPRDNWAKVDAALREAGLTVTRNVSRSPDSESTVDSKVRLQVTLIDEINLASRQTIVQSVAVRSVPEAFNKLADALHDVGARVVTSQLNDQDKPTVNAQINFSIERENAAKVEASVREAGDPVGRSVGRSADLQNTVDTKVSYQLTIVDQRNLQPRETVSELVAVRDVPGRYARVLDMLRLLDAQIYSSQLSEQNKNDVSGVLDFAIRRDSANAKNQAAVEKALGEASDIFSRTVVRSQDVTNTVDTKVRYQVTMRDADTQPPRETYTMEAEVPDVDKALADLEAAGIAVGGRAVDSTPSTTRNEKGEPVGRIVLDVPQARAGDVVNAVRDKGHVSATRRSRDDRVPEGELSRARIEVTVGTGAIMAGEGGLWGPIKSGLRTSGAGLLLALQFIIIGLCLIGPFVGVSWGLVKLFRWSRRKPAAKITTGPSSGSTPPGPVPA